MNCLQLDVFRFDRNDFGRIVIPWPIPQGTPLCAYDCIHRIFQIWPQWSLHWRLLRLSTMLSAKKFKAKPRSILRIKTNVILRMYDYHNHSIEKLYWLMKLNIITQMFFCVRLRTDSGVSTTVMGRHSLFSHFNIPSFSFLSHSSIIMWKTSDLELR